MDAARSLDRQPAPPLLRSLLALASLATFGVALWLVSVVLTVAPARDPARVPLWTGVAIGLAAFASLSALWLATGAPRAWTRIALLVASPLVLALAAYTIVSAIGVANAGGHFEGYLLLMGAIAGTHALLALAAARR